MDNSRIHRNMKIARDDSDVKLGCYDRCGLPLNTSLRISERALRGVPSNSSAALRVLHFLVCHHNLWQHALYSNFIVSVIYAHLVYCVFMRLLGYDIVVEQIKLPTRLGIENWTACSFSFSDAFFGLGGGCLGGSWFFSKPRWLQKIVR